MRNVQGLLIRLDYFVEILQQVRDLIAESASSEPDMGYAEQLMTTLAHHAHDERLQTALAYEGRRYEIYCQMAVFSDKEG